MQNQTQPQQTSSPNTETPRKVINSINLDQTAELLNKAGFSFEDKSGPGHIDAGPTTPETGREDASEPSEDHTNKEHTSRQWILDGLHANKEAEATISHLEDVEAKYKLKMEDGELTTEDGFSVQNVYRRTVKLRKKLTEYRRDNTRYLVKKNGGMNKDFWCVGSKHLPALRGYASEVDRANFDAESARLRDQVNEIFMEGESLFFNLDIVPCGQCVDDMFR